MELVIGICTVRLSEICLMCFKLSGEYNLHVINLCYCCE